MQVSGLTLAAALSLLPLASAWASPETCSDLAPPALSSAPEKRPLEAGDLVGLRDIGPNITFVARLDLLSVSPDGSQVAFQLRRAEPARNSYCLGMYVMPTRTGGKAVQVDRGGEFIRSTQSLLGVTNYPSGYTAVITPKWSPDGRSIAYLRRDNGVTQVWRAMADGTGATPLTQAAFDIEDFAWMPDGSAIRISGRPHLAAALAEITAESRSGYLYDDRFLPLASNTPFPRNRVETTDYVVRLGSTELQPVPVTTYQTDGRAEGVPDDATVVAAAGRSLAWVKPAEPDNVTAAKILQVKAPDGTLVTCDVELCDGIVDLWWSENGGDLYYMRREGWRQSQTALYHWRPHRGKPIRLFETADILFGCKQAHEALICAAEGSTQPRHLERIELLTGQRHDLFDPNPEFAGIRLGPVQRLYWKNNIGLPAFGDLVLPPDHKPGERHPLIVVQYDSRGFLRGGTDDEYPIQLFAAQGFAVLSFHHPRTVGASAGAKTWEEVNRLNHDDWADRKSIQSALEEGLKLAIGTGTVDPEHMGITGVSDGSNMLQFALVNSHLFRAAASSSCCEDPGTLLPFSGLAGARMMTDMGYPETSADGRAFWRAYSLAANADRIQAPVLMQLADTEYMAGLETYTALREQGTPVELYVYPDEYHEKWQPSHRYAVYTRNVDWFRFWLMGREDPNPAKADQYTRWREMSTRRLASLSTAPVRQ